MKVEAGGAEVTAWLQERTGCGATAGFRSIVARRADGSIAGAVGFDLWTENACQAHIALDSPAALRALLRPLFSYAFEQANKGLMMATIPGHNVRSLELVKSLGFHRRCIIEDGWAEGVPLHLFIMDRRLCRYLDASEVAACG